jgi:ring-1,2-phenylacetyl-CoA epoxidase subunit PaaC
VSEATIALLVSLADDELVLGYRESEWTGVAPMLEEDVALSSIAQDEIGHARALYELAAELGAGSDADAVAYDRPASAFLHARLCERPRGDWGEAIARRWLYELADAVRLEALLGSRPIARDGTPKCTTYVPLAQLVSKIVREESYHLEHARAWLERLAGDEEEGRARLTRGIEAVWADALGLFEPLASEPELVEKGIQPLAAAALQGRWLELAAADLAGLGLSLPAARAAALGGRRGDHGPDFAAQLDEMTLVRRLVPGAVW